MYIFAPIPSKSGVNSVSSPFMITQYILAVAAKRTFSAGERPFPRVCPHVACEVPGSLEGCSPAVWAGKAS